MISSYNVSAYNTPQLGISAVSTFRPPRQLSNDWFEGMPRKFVKHTGIQSRPVSDEDEVTQAIRATELLVAETRCDLSKCAAVVFTSPSFVPMPLARKHLGPDEARQEQLSRAAWQFVDAIGVKPRRVQATNTFCAGYARALELVLHKINPELNLASDEFILVLTSSRISRITDYSCPTSGALFGDLATATIIARSDSEHYPIHFDLLDARVDHQETNRPFFKFQLKEKVPTPTHDGGKAFDSQRFVFSLDGMGIADIAPRAMAASAAEMVRETGGNPEEIQHVLPHQAGFAIVRLTEMKLRDEGFTGKVINGMTHDIGNVSSGSIPYSLNAMWDELHGDIVCPIASVGPPGKNRVAQGCIALRATPLHEQTFASQGNAASLNGEEVDSLLN